MNILITNDDSIHAPGLKSLIDSASGFGNITVVAPTEPQSGQSSAITVGRPLRIYQLKDYNNASMFSVNGTPVDCVKLALHTICEKKPDLILSGINHGSNSGNAIIYSGTMGAVLEGCMNNIPSIGFSLLDNSLDADFSLSSNFITKIIAKVVKTGFPDYVALNVNIPAKIYPRGIRVCRAARGYWTEEYARYNDPIGKPFYMLTGRFINIESHAEDTDEFFLSKEYISVVPVSPDMTDKSIIDEVSFLEKP